MLQFRAGLRGRELPVHLLPVGIVSDLPCFKFPVQDIDGLEAPVPEAFMGQDRECDLRDVKPASVLRGVMDLQLRCESAGLRGREGIVERCDVMRVQIIHDEDDPLGIRIILVDQLLHLMGPVHFRAVLEDLGTHPSRQRFDEHEYGTRTVADVLAIHDHGCVCASESGAALPEELQRLLVHADDRPGLVVWAGIDFEDVLHFGDETGRMIGRDGPITAQMRFDLVFLKRSERIRH